MLGNLKREIIKMEDETGRDVQSRRMFNALFLRGGSDEDVARFEEGLVYTSNRARPRYFQILERVYSDRDPKKWLSEIGSRDSRDKMNSSGDRAKFREVNGDLVFDRKIFKDRDGNEIVEVDDKWHDNIELLRAIDGGVPLLVHFKRISEEPTVLEITPDNIRLAPRATMKEMRRIQKIINAGRDPGVTMMHWKHGSFTFDLAKNKRRRTQPSIYFGRELNYRGGMKHINKYRATTNEIQVIPNEHIDQWTEPRVYNSFYEVTNGDMCLYMNLFPCKVVRKNESSATKFIAVRFTDEALEMARSGKYNTKESDLVNPKTRQHYLISFSYLVPWKMASRVARGAIFEQDKIYKSDVSGQIFQVVHRTPTHVTMRNESGEIKTGRVRIQHTKLTSNYNEMTTLFGQTIDADDVVNTTPAPAVPVEPTVPRVSSSMPAPVVNVAPEPVVPIAPVAPETVVPVVPDAPEPVVPLEPVVPVAPEPVVPLEPVVPVAPKPVVERPVAQQISIDALNELAIKFASDETSLGCLKAVLDIDKRAADAIDRYGVTPLSVAKNGAVLQVLLDYGVDINRKFPTNHSLLGLGHTLLHIYAENYYHNSKSVGYLDSIPRDKIKHVIDDKFNEREGDGTYYSRDLTIKQLIQLGANVNATNDNGDTPLHLASKSRRSYNYISTRYDNNWTGTHLIQNGAELNVQNALGETPLHLAASQGRSNAASELIKAGARIDVKDNMQRTPLHWASERGARTQMKYLLNKAKEMGIIDEYVRMKDEDGMTALDIGSSRTMEWVMRV